LCEKTSNIVFSTINGEKLSLKSSDLAPALECCTDFRCFTLTIGCRFAKTLGEAKNIHNGAACFDRFAHVISGLSLSFVMTHGVDRQHASYK